MGTVMKKLTQADVNEYYTNSNLVYKLFFYSSNSLTMHHGFWDSKTKDVHQAALNENDFVAKLASCNKDLKILDAGCGVGGTAIYLAKKYHYSITGITLNSPQVKIAQQHAKKNEVSDLVSFSTADYTQTQFADNTFDCVYAIESVSHSPSKLAFTNEAFRILKPGGKLVIADGYVKRQPENSLERKLLYSYQLAFALPEASMENDMTNALQKSGFIHVQGHNKLKEVEPSIYFIYNIAKKYEYLVKLLRLIPFGFTKGLVSNYTALKIELVAHKLGMFDYFVHVAEKPIK